MSPTISMFYGIIVTMHWEAGEPRYLPHIHARCQDDEAVFSIPEGKMLASCHGHRAERTGFVLRYAVLG